MSDPRVKALVKQLRRTARALLREAEHCQAAADLVVVDRAVHAKNAATWRGRARACWRALNYIEDLNP